MSKVWHESGRWIFSGRFRGSIGLVDLLGSVLGSVEGRNPVRTKCCESQASVNLKQGRLGCLDGYSETFWGVDRYGRTFDRLNSERTSSRLVDKIVAFICQGASSRCCCSWRKRETTEQYKEYFPRPLTSLVLPTGKATSNVRGRVLAE